VYHCDACDDDRVWFEQNRHRAYRLRDLVPFEFSGPFGAPPECTAWRVLVSRADAGVLFRARVGLPSILPPGGASDANLAVIFDEVVPPELKAMLKTAREL
jgi:hypothetical protein